MSGRNGQAITPFIPSNDDLIEAYRRSGATVDFDQIVARFAALVFNECRRVTRDPHDAEDAAQLTFLALAIELKSGTVIRQPVAWLQRVAKRQALKIVRSRGRRQRREAVASRDEAAPLEPVSPAMEAADQAVTAGIVRDAIDALPEHYRLPLVLHYFGGMKLESIAREMGVSKQAVGTRLHRARKLLADRLSKRGLSIDAGALAGLIATLVPAGVVAALVRSATSTPAVPGAVIPSSLSLSSAAKTTIVAQSVSSMLRATALLAISKPLMAMCAAVAVSSGVGFAYVGPGTVVEAVRQRIDWGGMIDWLATPPKPSFEFVPDVKLPSLSQAPAEAASPIDELLLRPNAHATWLAQDARPTAPPTLALPTPPSPASATAIAQAQQTPTQRWPLPPMIKLDPTSTKKPIDRDAAPATAQGGGAAPTPSNRSNDDASGVPPAIQIAPAGSSGGGGGSAPRGGGGGASGAMGPQSRAGDYTLGGDGLPVPYTPKLHVGSAKGQTVHIAPAAKLHAGEIKVGIEKEDAGTVVQDGGSVKVDHDVVVGEHGKGRFEVRNRGNLYVGGAIELGTQRGAAGYFALTTGVTVSYYDQFVVGNRGDGELVLGSANYRERSEGIRVDYLLDTTTVNLINTSGKAGTFIIRASPDGSGLVSGWGTFRSDGTLINNDRVVADGYNERRALDFRSFSEVRNSIDNPVGGNAGWFARNGGQIVLPNFVVLPGNSTHTWGESRDDAKLDLINSLRFKVHDQHDTWSALSVRLRSTAANAGDLPTPADFAISALWQFVADAHFDPSAIDIAARYDDRSSKYFKANEDRLSLLAFIDGQWTPASAAWLDTKQKLIGGRFDGAFDYLAIGVDLAGGYRVAAATLAQTPEPAALLAGLGVAAMTLARRRRPVR